MRPLYFVLKFVLNHSLRVIHKTHVRVNSPKSWRTRTIFASNHPSAFLDPLTIAVRQNPIIHFMTRADIYKGYLKVVFWSAQMIPIYRAQDGEDAMKKNEEVFETCLKEIKRGKGLILFAEAFTDDIFIRRLKPIKKGSLRIGFFVCEKMEWKKKIYIQPTGINYTNPGKFRSSVLMSYGEKICLNDYQEQYKENPARTLVELTKRVEKGMQEQITHVEHEEWADFHENIMRLTRKGMNDENYDRKLSLKERWKYSRELALWMNEQNSSDEKLNTLKIKLENYFSALKKNQLSEEDVHTYAQKGTFSTAKNRLVLILGFLPFLIGAVHSLPVYFWFKPFVEKSFKRKVFWSGVKMVGGLAIAGIWNIPFLFLFHAFVYPSWILAFLYYFNIPSFSFIVMHYWLKNRAELKRKKQVHFNNWKELAQERNGLIAEIKALIPVA